VGRIERRACPCAFRWSSAAAAGEQPVLPGTVAWHKTMLAEGSRRSAAATARLRIGRRNPEVAGESGEIGEGGFFLEKKVSVVWEAARGRGKR
jgi:hypothetical protein